MGNPPPPPRNMPSASSELRAAMRALRNEERPLRLPAGTVVEQLRAMFGSNAAIVTALGIPTQAQAVRAHRARYPKARRTTVDRIATESRRRRQSALRNLQRYENGTRRPQATQRQLERLRDEEAGRRRQQGAGLERDGVTFEGGDLLVIVSSDERWRTGLPAVAFHPRTGFSRAVDDENWERAAELFFDGWGQAYGIGYVTVPEAEGLALAVGMDPSAPYQEVVL